MTWASASVDKIDSCSLLLVRQRRHSRPPSRRQTEVSTSTRRLVPSVSNQTFLPRRAFFAGGGWFGCLAASATAGCPPWPCLATFALAWSLSDFSERTRGSPSQPNDRRSTAKQILSTRQR